MAGMIVTLNNKIAGALSSQHNPLNLRGYFLEQEDIHSLAMHLNREARITVLSLYDCNIGGNWAQFISEAICDNAFIHTLDLTGNDLGDVGIVSLARALEVNASISHLYLGRNSIGDKGINRLAEALQINQGVNVINLERNGLSEEHLEIIVSALNSRKTPAEFFVAGNEIASPVGRGILERVQSASNIRVHGIGANNHIQNDWVERINKQTGFSCPANIRLA